MTAETLVIGILPGEAMAVLRGGELEAFHEAFPDSGDFLALQRALMPYRAYEVVELLGRVVAVGLPEFTGKPAAVAASAMSFQAAVDAALGLGFRALGVRKALWVKHRYKTEKPTLEARWPKLCEVTDKRREPVVHAALIAQTILDGLK